MCCGMGVIFGMGLLFGMGGGKKVKGKVL